MSAVCRSDSKLSHTTGMQTPHGSLDTQVTQKSKRACNECKRMKIRCEGGEKPPCEPCQTRRLECDFERSKMPRSGQERLCRMEQHIAEIRALLITILEKVSDHQSGENSPSSSLPRSPFHTHANHGIPFALMGLLGSNPENDIPGPGLQSNPSILLVPADRSLAYDQVTQGLPHTPPHQQKNNEFYRSDLAAP